MWQWAIHYVWKSESAKKQALDFYSELDQVWATLTLSPSPQVLQNFFSAIKHNKTQVWNSLTDRHKWKYKDKCIIFSDVSESRRWRCVRLCRGKHPWRDFVQVGLPEKLFLQRLKLLLQRLPGGQQSSSPLFPFQFNHSSPLPPRRFPFLLDPFNIFSRLPPRRTFHLDTSLQHPPSLNPKPTRKCILPIQALPKLEKTESCQNMGKFKFQSTFIISSQVEQFG